MGRGDAAPIDEAIAKQFLWEMLGRVESGETFAIMSGGKQIAWIEPAPTSERETTATKVSFSKG
jgi:antitoxin (DNA-binding transcriptional repressor) of toxin-antitoxin stability system